MALKNSKGVSGVLSKHGYLHFGIAFSFHECNTLRYFCVCVCVFFCIILCSFIDASSVGLFVRFRIVSCSTNMTLYFEMLTKFDGENRLLIKRNFMCKIVF
jgi:hypothetical protein